MRHFLHYHNAEKMGYSASDITDPGIFTNKSLRYVPSSVVWLISGEGKSPKTYFLAAVFKANRTKMDTFDHPDFKNAAYGEGSIFGGTIELNGLSWFERFKSDQKNFKNGLTEVKDDFIINKLRELAGIHTL